MCFEMTAHRYEAEAKDGEDYNVTVSVEGWPVGDGWFLDGELQVRITGETPYWDVELEGTELMGNDGDMIFVDATKAEKELHVPRMIAAIDALLDDWEPAGFDGHIMLP